MKRIGDRLRAARVVFATLPLALASCVKAPAVSVLTTHTALERQAAGEYPSRERDLEDASLSPGPDPIPRERLLASGEGLHLGVVDELVTSAEADEGRVDALLVARCIGEATSGLLEVTADTCGEDEDANEIARLVGRVNVHRRQVWAFLATRSPGTTEDGARDAWRSAHADRIVCGAQIQRADGRWETKTCTAE